MRQPHGVALEPADLLDLALGLVLLRALGLQRVGLQRRREVSLVRLTGLVDAALGTHAFERFSRRGG